MQEIFKTIRGYEGIYEVSNLGRVKSLKRFKRKQDKILKPTKNKKTGYLYIDLKCGDKRKNRRVNVLVAESFLNHDSSNRKYVVDHINNDRTDNRLENLKVITNRENTSKDKKNKTSKYTGVCWYKTTNKWKSSIKIDNKTVNLGYYDCEYEAHLSYLKKLKTIER